MDILVTGGCGFIGSHVAERFYKEGHKVFIIDNLTSGLRSNINFKHKFYEMAVEDKRCEDIFCINKFNVVVHLAAQTSVPASFENPYEDTVSNVTGLINMLSLSERYGVKRFIFISSAAVYGDPDQLPIDEDTETNPMAPYGISKLVGEMYCHKWHEIYGLSTVCLRLSNVYGPRQAAKGEGGVVSVFMKQILDGQSLTVYGDGKQTRDFIYVEDIADAVYRCVESSFCGVMNLSTNTEISINDLIDTLAHRADIKEVLHKEKRSGDISRSSMDNSRIKRELNWLPKYNFEEGLQKTFDWYASIYKKQEKETEDSKKSKTAKPRSKLVDYAIPFVESLLGFIAVILIERSFNRGDHFFIDLKLLYIILMGIAYGTKHSIMAVALSSSLFIISNASYGRDLISLFYDPNSLLHIAYYLFAGFSVGYTIDMKNRKVKSQDLKMEVTEKKLKFVTKVYNETIIVKNELQKQIMASQDSFGKIYSIIKELDTFDPEDVFSSAVQVMEKILKVNSIAIYVMSRNGLFARLVANSGSLSSHISKSMKVEDSPALKYIMYSKEIFFNKKLDPSLPIMMAPITDNGKTVAIISILELDFDNINLYYQNLFKVASDMISSSLSKAHRYQEATNDSRYISGTAILNRDSFEKLLHGKMQTKEKEMANYVLLCVDAADPADNLEHRISNTIRELDYIGLGKDNRLYILLSNTNEKEAGTVAIRLTDKGISTSIPAGADLIA